MNSAGLRKGFTTGTCAQAATKGACIMLTQRKQLGRVEVITPSGVKLSIRLIDQEIGDDFAKCAVIKDAGSDPDITNGAKICAEAKFFIGEGVKIKGGKGVGRVTLPGLAVRVGEWAINPTPRRMILGEASRFLPQEKGIEVTISVLDGERLAKKTFNPKLGIAGGISIIGTTGIVEPKSLDAYKATLALQLDVLKAQGYNEVVFVLGYVGEAFCKEKLKLKENSVIKIGDHIGFMLKEAVKRKIKKILLAGHIGKLIKLTNSQFNTHCDFGDNRLDSIAGYAASCGADKKLVAKILCQKTAEAVIPILREAGLANDVFRRVAADVLNKCREFVKGKVAVSCILLSLTGELLAKTDGL